MSDWRTPCLKTWAGRRSAGASSESNAAQGVLCTSCRTGMTRPPPRAIHQAIELTGPLPTLKKPPVVSLSMLSAAYAAETSSQAFLKNAIEGNFAEVAMGKLAQQNGQNDNVKRFGQTLIDDHSAANQKAMEAARSMGITPPDGPNAKQKADYNKMSKMSGAQFDRDFATHMVMDHKKDIAEYRKAAKQADAAGEYAKSQVDVLQGHLQTAKSLKASKTSNR